MIAIVNISSDDVPLTGTNQYELRINEKVMCTFEHNRQVGGLSQCLRDAADAYDAKEANNEDLLIKILNLLES